MSPRPFAALVVTALVLTAATVAAACGDDKGQVSVEEYLQQARGLFERIALRLAPLYPSDGPRFASEEEEREAMRHTIEATLATLEEASDEGREIKPPPEAEEAHDKLLSSLAAMEDWARQLREQLDRAESMSEFEDWVDSRLLLGLALSADWDDAVHALQQLADDHGIDLDFER